MAILLETMRRMGVMPMADGGVLGTSTRSNVDRPIRADGIGLIGWIRELAYGEAQLVWARNEQRQSGELQNGVAR